jgi:hypothetical protein
MSQFTASEIRHLSRKMAIALVEMDARPPKDEHVMAALDAYADLLEAQERAQPQVTDALIEIGCRAICARNGWNPDEPVTYSGTHTKCQNRDGSLVPQWSMHANDVRAALEAAITPKEQS